MMSGRLWRVPHQAATRCRARWGPPRHCLPVVHGLRRMSESAVAAVTSGREASEQGDDTGSLLAGVLDNVKCCGCGALLHTSDKNSPGSESTLHSHRSAALMNPVPRFVPNHIVEDVMSKYDESMSMGVDVRSARAEAVHSIICMRCHQ